VFELDRRIFFALYGGPELGGALALVMIALTVLGSGWSMVGLVPLLVVRRTRRFAVALVATLVGTSVLVFALKALVGRTRPLHALAGVRGLFDAPTDFSFPSGHAAGSFAFFAFTSALLLASPPEGTAGGAPRAGRRGVWSLVAALFALATGVAMSRVYLGCHFPLDVAGGALVGLGTGWTAGRFYASRRPAAA
jgi:undecaprenyl-diphosphatase